MDTIPVLIIATICFAVLFYTVYKGSLAIPKYTKVFKYISIFALLLYILAFITPISLITNMIFSYIILIALFIIEKSLQKKRA